MNDFKYDFDKDRSGRTKFNRLRPVLLFIAVLAITAGIVYYLIPSGKGRAPSNPPPGGESFTEEAAIPDAGKLPETGNYEQWTSDTGSESEAPLSSSTEESDAESPAAPSETVSTDAPTQEPEKGKPWVGDPRENPLPPSPVAEAELAHSAKKLEPLFSGDPADFADIVVVRPGDSLSRIAQRHRTTVEGLRRFNRIKGDFIRIGQKLSVISGPWRIIVDKSRRELVLEQSRGDAWNTFGRFQVGLGRLDKTPEAEFVISSRLRHPTWYAPDGRIFRYGDPENQLGDYFLKLAESGQPDKPLLGYGIHGTNDDSTVGKNWSNGCIRMHNREVELLYYLVPAGTPVKIVAGGTGAQVSEI